MHERVLIRTKPKDEHFSRKFASYPIKTHFRNRVVLMKDVTVTNFSSEVKVSPKV